MAAFCAPRVAYSILFFVMAMAIVLVSRPTLLFDKSHELSPRPFGLGPGRTLFSLGAVTVCLAVLSFYVFALIDMISN